MKIIKEKERMHSKQTWTMTLHRSQVQRLKRLSERRRTGELLDLITFRISVEAFGKYWSEFSVGSIEHDHRLGEYHRASL